MRGFDSGSRGKGPVGTEVTGSDRSAVRLLDRGGVARLRLESEARQTSEEPLLAECRVAQGPVSPVSRCMSLSTTASIESFESEVDAVSTAESTPLASSGAEMRRGSSGLLWHSADPHVRGADLRLRTEGVRVRDQEPDLRHTLLPVTTQNVRVGLVVVRGALRPGDPGADETGMILGFDGNVATVHWHGSGTVCDRLRLGASGDLLIAGESPSAGVAVTARPRRSSQGLFARREQTCILLDWDDTIFPTTHVRHCGQPNRAHIMECHATAVEFLRLASSLGRVVIVTLAQTGWVQQCCNRHFPQLGRLLRESGVRVVHARDGEGETMRSYVDMKARAISRELSEFYSQYCGQTWKNVISIGDSEFEREGTRRATAQYIAGTSCDPRHVLSVRTKTFKLAEHPSVEDLTLQIGLLHKWLHRIVALDSSLDLELADVRNAAAIRNVEAALRDSAASGGWCQGKGGQSGTSPRRSSQQLATASAAPTAAAAAAAAPRPGSRRSSWPADSAAGAVPRSPAMRSCATAPAYVARPFTDV